jgi:hypothetical protein
VQEPVADDKVKQLVSKCTHRDVDGSWYVDGVQLVHETCFALDSIKRKSTAAQPAPVQEPVAKVCPDLPGSIGWNPCLTELPPEGTELFTHPLAQPEPVQEPVAWMVYTLDGKSVCVTDNPADFTDKHKALPLYTTPPAQPTGDKLTPDEAQPATEESSEVDHGDELTIAYLDGVHTGKQIAKREWVGLTDDEFNELYDAYKNSKGIGALMQRVEAKLREKNGGAAQPADHTEEYLDMVSALERLLVVQDELCSIDHHGYCQSHYLDNVNSHGGCRVANARALVAKVRGKP